MEWNRTIKRTKVKVNGKDMTFLEYLEQLRDSLPKIIIEGKPMDHETGLIHCVLLSKTWSDLSNRIAIYVAKINNFYDNLKKDEEEFKQKHNESSNNNSGSEGDSSRTSE